MHKTIFESLKYVFKTLCWFIVSNEKKNINYLWQYLDGLKLLNKDYILKFTTATDDTKLKKSVIWDTHIWTIFG